LLLIIISSLLIQVNAQQTAPRSSVDKGSAEDRFNYILKESVTSEDSKIVKGWWLYHLKTFVIDTIKSLNNEIAVMKNTMSASVSNYDSLKNELQQTNEKLTTAISEKNSLSLFGILMNKSAYNSILWSIIGGLAFLFVLFVLLFKRSNFVTVQTKNDLEELKIEFDTFRKRALEREEKLVRKHHDEIQRYKEGK
jgi:hypothetical protein